MAKILINNSGADVLLEDLAELTILNGTQYTIDPIDFLRFARSSDLVTAIGNGSLVVNDGSFDLSISDGVDLIKLIYPTTIDATITGVNIDGSSAVPTTQGSGARRIPVDRRMTLNGDGTNSSMDVDGDPNIQNFFVEVPTGETWYLDSVTIFLADSGTADVDDFGSISGQLTNGLQFYVRIDGVDIEVGNFRDNTELALCFAKHAVPSGAPGEEGRGWFDESDYFIGAKEYRDEIKLLAGDRVGLKVRDDLRGLNEMKSVVIFTREGF